MMIQIRSTLRPAVLLCSLFVAVSAAQAEPMSKDEYKAGKERISTQFKADRATCGSLSGNGKDICVLEAKGREDVARAELEYAHTGKHTDHAKIAEVRADAAYAIARERCDDFAGNAKSLCTTQAKADHTKAMADAKVGKQINEARQENAAVKSDADYTIAVQKCDTLAGDAKAGCIADAKARFGKS